MKRITTALIGVLALILASHAHAAQTWQEGKHYVRMALAQQTSVPAGKIEVMEVFSYGCIACNGFQPVIEKLRNNLPPNAQMVFLPASFKPEEDWPMFQRAYFAAQSLGIADRAHQGIYDAVWKTGELAISDPASRRLKNPQPTLDDAARCYARLTGVKPEAFVTAAKSFAVNVKMRAADAQVEAMEVPSTPCIVVNGKYRLIVTSLGSSDELVELVKYLVAKESTPPRP
jgi:thiol:disulfide interchange protein DsbA